MKSAAVATSVGLIVAAIAPLWAKEQTMSAPVQAATAENQFGFNILHELAGKNPNANTFISPTSIHLALSMTLNGAAGGTRDEMAKTLGLGGFDLPTINTNNEALIDQLQAGSETGGSVEIANSLWAKQGLDFRPNFIDAVKKRYDASLQTLDFSSPSAVGTINNWVKDKTAGKIPSIVDRISPGAILYLINAVHFKAAWQTPFPVALTKSATFTTGAGASTDVSMMNRAGHFHYGESATYQAVQVPYKGGRYVMYVVLPKSGQKLADVVGALNGHSWGELKQGLGERRGHLGMPKTNATFSDSLVPALKALGMTSAFDGAVADFKPMIDTQDSVSIGDVKHKTFIAIDEQGTEAAAVTSVEMLKSLAMPDSGEPFTMTVDHPFLIAIEERTTGALVFLGEINDPTKG
jgi:serpin B